MLTHTRQGLLRSYRLSQQAGGVQVIDAMQQSCRLATAATLSSPGTSGSGEGSKSILDNLMYVPSVVCAVLAAWQLDRRQQKTELLEGRKRALSGSPDDIFELSSVPERNTLVSWSGAYDERSSQFIGPRAKTTMGVPEKGWIVVTPVYSSDGKRAILVRRGWVPDSWRAQHVTSQHSAAAPHVSPTTSSVKAQHQTPGASSSAGRSWWWFSRSRKSPEVQAEAECGFGGVGVVSRGEIANSLSFPNEPETGSWHWLDAAGVASLSGLPENTPLVEAVEIDQEAGAPRTAMQIATDKYRHRSPVRQAVEYPEPKKRDQFLEFSVMPYDHLNYALTWAMLSAATAYLATRLLSKGRGPSLSSRGRPKKAAA